LIGTRVSPLALDIDTARGIAVALGCGLLVGLERERRKGRGPDREVAGLRSFAVAALAGALAALLASDWLIAAGLLGLALLVASTRWQQGRPRDPGLTTELALLATYLIGALALPQPLWAAIAALLITALLALRARLHHFAHRVLREEELHDGLLLAALALLVMPLLPADKLSWLGGISPRQLGSLVLLLLALQALGHIALRLLGSRAGLLASGLFAGLVSSTATVASFGTQARAQPEALRGLAAAALMSTAATWLQTVLMLGPVAPALLRDWAPIAAAGMVTALLCAWLLAPREAGKAAATARRPLRPREALLLAALLSGVSAAVSLAQQQLGELGVLGGAVLAGLADAHAALPSLAALAAESRITPELLAKALLLALGANSLTRSLVAVSAGGPRYGGLVAAALALQLLAAGFVAWLG
jgi:uncharacterized membrane protein (DUF4010 family)